MMISMTEHNQRMLRIINDVRDIASILPHVLAEKDANAASALGVICETLDLESEAIRTAIAVELGQDRREALRARLALMDFMLNLAGQVEGRIPALWLKGRFSKLSDERVSLVRELNCLDAEEEPRQTAAEEPETTT